MPRPTLPEPERAQSADSAERIRIFSPSGERINIFVGLLFVVVSAISFFYPSSKQRFELSGYEVFALNILLLNITHTAWTPFLPVFVPEIRGWWESTKFWGLGLSKASCLVFLLTVTAFFLTLTFSLQQNTWSNAIVFFAFKILATQHTLSQIRGLSRMYDQASRSHSSETSKRTSRFIELQKVAMGLIQLQIFCKIALNHYWPVKVAFEPYQTYLTFSLVATSVALLCFVAAEQNARRSNKFWFMSRLLPMTLTGYGNPWPAFSILGMHGIENACVIHSILQKRDVAQPRVQQRWFIGLLLLTVALTCLCFLDGWGQFEITRGWLPEDLWKRYSHLLLAISAGISTTHYFIERQMFRMRDPATRAKIAPLLVISK